MRQIAPFKGACLAVIVLCLPSSLGRALDLTPEQLRGSEQNQRITVLQNRFFTKSLRPEIGVLGGMILNEAYTDTKIQGARLGLFFSEWFGVEYQWSENTIDDSDDRLALKTLNYYPVGADGDVVPDTIVHPDPEVNSIYQVQDVTAVVTPFYGKMNLFDAFIVYSDVYFLLGRAQLITDQGGRGALTVGGGQRFYLAKSFSLRLDIRNRTFTEIRAGEESQRNTLSFDVGASVFIN
jgi:outer membrane beta-barrel protein